MPTTLPKYSPQDICRIANHIYESQLKHVLEPNHFGEIVAIDIVTSAWELGANEIEAAEALLARLPNGQLYIKKVGHKTLARIGNFDRFES